MFLEEEIIMIKKTIKYTDFNGTAREEDFYFNLTEAELMDLNLSEKGGLKGYLESIISAQDEPAMVNLFKQIINLSYGIKSVDGRKFMKSPEILAEFTSTQAYSNLYMSLITNGDEAIKFITGVVPEDFQKRITEATATNNA